MTNNKKKIITPNDISSDIEIEADVCIIGSGAGGAVMAAELSRAGKEVVILERGGYYTATDFIQLEGSLFPILYQPITSLPWPLTFNFSCKPFTNQQMQIIVVQGNCVGGSTVVYEAVCYRPPGWILEDEWKIKGINEKSLAPYIDQVFERLSVKRVKPNQVNENNLVLERGGDALKYKGERLERNSKDCKECGFCQVGCHYDRKQSMLITYVKDALESATTKIYTNCRVDKVIVKKDKKSKRQKAYAVKGVFLRPLTGNTRSYKINVKAGLIIVSAGAINSSKLLLNSRVSNKNKQVGKRLSLHVSVNVFGMFDQVINLFRGIPFSYGISQFSTAQGSGTDGYVIEGISFHPMSFAMQMPYLGWNHREIMKDYKKIASSTVILHDKPNGEVRVNWRGNSVLKYDLSNDDKRKLANGVKKCGEIHFEAGAKKVFTNHIKKKEFLSKKGLESFGIKDFTDDSYIITTAHPQGGNAMGNNDDTNNSVVNSYCESHEVDGLFVCDASVFPTSVGLNPSITIMALAKRAANYIKDNSKRYFKN